MKNLHQKVVYLLAGLLFLAGLGAVGYVGWQYAKSNQITGINTGSKTSTKSDSKGLTIKEWGLVIPKTDKLEGLYYTVQSGDNGMIVTLSTPARNDLIRQVKGCSSGIRSNSYDRVMLGDQKALRPSGQVWSEQDFVDPNSYVGKVGSMYYRRASTVSVACVVQADKDLLSKIYDINKAINDQFKQALSDALEECKNQQELGAYCAQASGQL